MKKKINHVRFDKDCKESESRDKKVRFGQNKNQWGFSRERMKKKKKKKRRVRKKKWKK